jgi:ParB family chromosome partitioning protein
MSSPEKYDSIYWVEVDKIVPNPYQPRKEFDEAALASLAESIRQYGVLQPLVVTRQESIDDTGNLTVTYELIAGERRLRASRIAGLTQVPVVIRHGEESGRMKLELAIIENLQREDLNPVDRAKAFERLIKEFNFTHAGIGEKIGKSREYVSNSVRILLLPKDMQDALSRGEITEGHTRPLLMLSDRPDEQLTLFKEIMTRRLTVRESEQIAKRIAVDRARKKAHIDPTLVNVERELSEALGTRVMIEQRENGGKIVIDFFSGEDLKSIIGHLQHIGQDLKAHPASSEGDPVPAASEGVASSASLPEDDRSKEKKEDEGDLYSLKHFSL